MQHQLHSHAAERAPASNAGRRRSGREGIWSTFEPTLDQMFADPIVQQLMHGDALDETVIRRLLKQVAVARPTP